MERVLVIGAAGQIGSELTVELRKVHGNDNVFATDIKEAPADVTGGGPFSILDVLDNAKLNDLITKNGITQIYLLAAVLSGNAEKKPLSSWNLNMQSLINVLELCREKNLNKLFWPSSIAVFGPTTPRKDTPQLTVMEPGTIYGISKLTGERWCEYYHKKHGLDVRSIRYPGLISYKTHAGGGTTDYAVEIFYEAIEKKRYECFLEPDTRLPMMFMEDATRGTIELMEAPSENIGIRSSYNLNGISFSPAELAGEIKKHIPQFQTTYKPDFRQKIAESWPESIDDSSAKNDWGWKHEYGLDRMTEVMLREIEKKISTGK
jgi:nucleoside-diphosphate-sugar epimerase